MVGAALVLAPMPTRGVLARGKGTGSPRKVFKPRGNFGDSSQSASQSNSAAVKPRPERRTNESWAWLVGLTAVTQPPSLGSRAVSHAKLADLGGTWARCKANRTN